MTDPWTGDIPEEDLHAYVDGQLSSDRQALVEAWLKDNPTMAATIAAWRAQNEDIRALFVGGGAADADADADVSMVRALHSRQSQPAPRWQLAAAAAVLLAFGGLAGALLTRALDQSSPSPMALSLPEASRDSYLVYAGEVRHPVEVGADQEAHLESWLGKRLGAALTAPDLAPLGFHLVGGRLVPFGGAPGALLMYEDSSGARLTCLIARDATGGTGLRFADANGVATFSWVEGGLGYALSAPFTRERLLDVANAVLDQS